LQFHHQIRGHSKCLFSHRKNTKFTINVTVTDVQDLFAWQFKLGYNSSLVFEGYKINENFFALTPKKVMVTYSRGTILGGTPLNGDVFLASIYFTATVPGEYAFDLFETALINSDKENISHQVVDGVPNITHDIALLGLTSDPSGWVPVPQGDPVYIAVTVKNNGNFTENFSLNVYADRNVSVLLDELVVAETTVSLEPGEISTINLVWNTADSPYGSYYLSAKAQITDDNMENNFIGAASFVGGICHRWDPPRIDYTTLYNRRCIFGNDCRLACSD